MKTLIVEDDFTSRVLLQELLKGYGLLHCAVNGNEAVEAVRVALLEKGEPYDLICMDIMMPGMDGHEALRQIRRLEESWGILSTFGAKIIMTTALDDPRNVMEGFYGLCDAYVTKPIRTTSFLGELRRMNLIE